MKRQHMQIAAVAAILVVIGLLFAGVSASTLFLLAIVLACPLMMLFMHGGHGGHGGGDHERIDRDDAGMPGRGANDRDDHRHH